MKECSANEETEITGIYSGNDSGVFHIFRLRKRHNEWCKVGGTAAIRGIGSGCVIRRFPESTGRKYPGCNAAFLGENELFPVD